MSRWGEGGGKRRGVSTMPVPSKETLLKMIQLTPVSLTEKAFFSFLYLTGARVGEICQNKEVNYIRQIINKRGWVIWRETKTGHNWRGVTAGQLSTKEMEFKKLGVTKFIYLIENIPTEKRRNKALFRNLPIDPVKDEGFIKIFEEYVDNIHDNPTQPLFPFDRNMAGRIIKKFDPTWFPHFLRHMRLTHLSIDEDYSALELKQITGWIDIRPAETYVHMQWHDIARKHF